MDTRETYTPGYTQTASNLMARRTASSHAAFLLPHLLESSRLLDCGCGPGSMSCDFAKIVSTGHVTGIDREQSQIELARNRAEEQNLNNVSFQVASIYNLPFSDCSFDVVFAHAIFEHISSHDKVLKEIFRVLAPGGLAAIRSPDWGGFIVVPDTPSLQSAIQHYAELQTANGGDIHIGRKLPGLLRAAGFEALNFSATYDCSLSPMIIAEYLALPLVASDGEALREWGRHPDAVFAQAWCEILGSRNA
ncbi:MAG: methyltransferase domain-containing protein [Kaiparowitsia implicata GSE-PSE-MK54-09C]|jgi:SAM-dependent methyltransferase|nr:methyltransferase domain-containing protein [Kaiparowitsia implicata GSE-PSE-MK54-09C]